MVFLFVIFSTLSSTSPPCPPTQHVSFWDRRKTGVIYPWDTYNGFRALGFCSLVAVSYALAFHLLHTSYWTSVSLSGGQGMRMYVVGRKLYYIF